MCNASVEYSTLKYEKLVTAVRVLQNTQNVVISRCYFSENETKCTKIYNARAQPLFSSLNLLFGDGLVAVAVAVCIRVSNSAEKEEILDKEYYMRMRK